MTSRCFETEFRFIPRARAISVIVIPFGRNLRVRRILPVISCSGGIPG